MRENKLGDLSMDLSVKMMKLCNGIKGHYSAVNQMERATTSIGANIRRRTMPTARRILSPNCRSR